jgi:hypothetical protein
MKNFKYILFVVAGLNLGLLGSVFAQTEFTLSMMPNVMQSTYLNPSVMPNNTISFTTFGSMYMGMSSAGLKLGDLVYRNPGEKVNFVDLNRTGELLLNRNNYLFTGASFDWFAFQIRKGQNMFSFNITEQVNSRISYPGNFVSLFIHGNTRYLGQELDLSGFGLNFTHYREYGMGFARDFGRFTLGGRLKVLQGITNLSTTQSKMYLNSNEDNFATELVLDMEFNSSLLPIFSELDMSQPTNLAGANIDPLKNDPFSTAMANFVTNFNNLGVALDMGATYAVDSRLNLSASLINLGFIGWRSTLTNVKYQSSFEFDGIDVTGASDFDFKEYSDDLKEKLTGEVSHNPYRTMLTPQMFLTANYALFRGTHIIGTFHAEYFQKVRPAFIFGGYQRVGRLLGVAANYSMRSGGFNDFGFGWFFSPGPFQFYCMSDNLNVALNYKNFNALSFRMGMNMALGNPDKQQKKKKKEMEKRSYPGFFFF